MTRKIPILGVDLPPALRKAPNRELPPSLRKSEARTNYGGGPPPGYGIDDSESHLWREPTYRKHPTTGRLEAVDQGLFFRMWPEHVKKVREMKANGWPHVEIVRTAKELWRKQQDAYQDDQTLADQHREARQGERAQQVQDMRAGKLNDEPAEWGQPPQQFEQAAGNPFARGFSQRSFWRTGRSDSLVNRPATRVVATSALATSSMVRCVASRGLRPAAMFRSTFSTTTIASSTTMPIARRPCRSP